MDVKIEPGWKHLLQQEFEQPYFKEIVHTLKLEKQQGKTIYPPGPLIFNAFQATPFDKVKVVILGQDPYHNPGQAHGLSFSVPQGVQPPPSLVNIFKEMHSDLGLPVPQHGNLEQWAHEGVLLLNAALTVQANQPMSHSKIGWHHFTDDVIRLISERKEHVVFILWGRFAQGKEVLIDHSRHLVIKSAHPSPLSAHNGFFGSKPFSKTNHWLESKGIQPVHWQLS